MQPFRVGLSGGGLDSIALILYQQQAEEPLDLVVHVDYGQTAFSAELKASEFWCELFKIPLEIVEEKQMHLANPDSLLLGRGEKPFIRGRNLWLMQLAAAIAIRKFGDRRRIDLKLGLCKENMMFDDANEGFMVVADMALQASFGKLDGDDKVPLVRAFAPSIHVPKLAWMKEACMAMNRLCPIDRRDAIKEFFERSFTCWTPVNGNECGTCYHCTKKADLRKQVETELLQ